MHTVLRIVGKARCAALTVVAVSALTAALAGALQAGGPPLQAGIARLLDPDLGETTSANSAAREQYELLKKRYPNDRRIDYACALTLISERKYRDAVPLISRYLEGGHGEPHAYCAKIWALLQDRRHADALDEAVALSARFPRGPSSPEGRYYEAAEFIGTVFAYIELARPNAVENARRLESKNRVLANLGKTYAPAFDQARGAVVGQLAEIQSKHKAVQDEIAAKSEKRKDQVKSALDANRERLRMAEESMQASTEQLRDAQRELAQIRQELSTLNQDRTKVGAQMVVLQAQMSLLLQSNTVDDRTDLSRPTVQTTYVQPNSQVSLLKATAISVALAGLSKQALGMDRRILGYQARIAELTGKGERQMQMFAESDADVRETQESTKRAEYQLSRRAKSAAANSGVLSEKIANFSTYSPFPTSQERKRVLGWFAK